MYSKAALRPWAGAELASEQTDALSHTNEPAPSLVVTNAVGGSALTVICDLQLKTVGPVTYLDAGVSGAGVLERVRQRLLDDPVGREIDA